MLMPCLSAGFADETYLTGYIKGTVMDDVRVWFRLRSNGELVWTVFVGGYIAADSELGITEVW